MKKLIAALVLITLFPAVAFATTAVSWGKNGTTEFPLYINDFIGIGTTSPYTQFAIAQTGGLLNPALIIDGSGNSTGAEMALVRGSNTGTEEANIDFNTVGTEYWQLGMQNNNSNDFELWDGSDNPIFTIKQSTNDVGIGTTTPYAELSIWGDTVATDNILQAVTSASSTAFVVKSGGNVGIGTTSPFANLSIAGTAGGTTSLFVISTSTSASATSTALTVDQNGNLSLSNGASVSAPVFLAGDGTAAAGGFAFTGAVGTGLNRNGTLFNFSVAGTNRAAVLSTGFGVQAAGVIGWSLNTAPNIGDTGMSRFSAGVVAFGNGTAANVSGTVLAATIGVGTTTPQTPLEVSGTGTSAVLGQLDSNIRLEYRGSTASDGGEISFAGQGTGGSQIDAAISNTLISSSGAGTIGNLVLSTKATTGGTTLTPNITIVGSTGNVGVATSTPNRSLVVNSVNSAFLSLYNSSTGDPGILLGGNGGPDAVGQIRYQVPTGLMYIVANSNQNYNFWGTQGSMTIATNTIPVLSNVKLQVNGIIASGANGSAVPGELDVLRTSDGLATGKFYTDALSNLNIWQSGGAGGQLFFTGATQKAILTNAGNFGIATATPFAQLSLMAGGSFASQAASTVFAIGSSTQGNATSTLLTVNSVGQQALLLDGNSTTPILSIGASGTSVTNFISFNGGRAMFGYDAVSNEIGTDLGEAEIDGGSGKGVIFRTNSTSGQLRTGVIAGGFSAGTATLQSKFAIGTTSPSATLSVMVGDLFNSQAVSTAFIIGSSTMGMATSTLFTIDTNGHQVTGGATPTVSGGTSTVVGNDNNGTVTVIGTLLTSVTLTFAQAWASAPDCQESDNSTAITADITSISTTQIVFGFSAGINTGTVWYSCKGHY